MSTSTLLLEAPLPRSGPSRRDPPPPQRLENGDRLSQPEFHRRYLAMPPGVKAELIGGVVHMPSPLRMPHALSSRKVAGVLAVYEADTPGVEGMDNATTILGP